MSESAEIETTRYSGYLSQGDTPLWLISNVVDTTVADSDNTYDRMVTTRSLDEDHTGMVGVLRFDEVFDFGTLSTDPDDVSDHYPVWAEFYVGRDTD